MHANEPEMAKKWEKEEEGVEEAKKRDYKAEYKKFQSSKKMKKYRAELNKYNRQKGTYGNGDKKDASHKGGKIVGFEEESKNRGRKEKSRLKKEEKLVEGNYVELQIPMKDRKKTHLALIKSKAKEGRHFDYGVGRGSTFLVDLNKKFKDKVLNFMDKLRIQYKVIREETSVELYARKLVREVILTESGKEIAKTILQQLGGNKFIAMTGAKNIGFTNKGIQMGIGRNAKGVTHVIIDLDRGKDLYNMEFVKVGWDFKRKTIKKLNGVYADQLQKIFTKYTGLHTRL
jgi:hypothetical protein